MVPCTIVIPTHNREDLLVRAVRSALQACPADGEVLVVDDKSIVPAAQVLAAETDPRLRVIVNTGPKGAASTRNLGVASALGGTVFFVDDDDEIVADYCARVLGRGALEAEWGFSSVWVRHADSPDILRQRRRLALGSATSVVSMRHVVAAMSDGFWIRRACFQAVGGLDEHQSIDEDTDLCVRLLASDRRPWYEPSPGMVVYRGYVPASAAGAQLTVATPLQRGLECYRRTYEKNAPCFSPYSAARWYLATRYLRRAVKHAQLVQARAFLDSVQPMAVRLALRIFYLVKVWNHAGRNGTV